MTPPSSTGDAYYWAGGEKVVLHATDEVCLDLDASPLRGLDAAVQKDLRAKGRPLTGALWVVDRPEAEAVLGKAIDSDAGVHPVYRAEGALVVVLPEVRLEGEDESRLAELVNAVSGAHVAEHTQGRVVAVPDSGRGEDALAIANELAESPETELAQARFLRVVPRPDLSRRSTDP